MSCENHLRILFTSYPIRSISESPYLNLFYSCFKLGSRGWVLTVQLQFMILRFYS